MTASGAENAVLETARPYYIIVAVPSVFVCLTLVLSACLRASKDTVTPMFVSAASNILNIILDAFFLYFDMGITGLALATTLSRILACLILFLRLFYKTEGIKLSLPNFIPNKELLLSLTRISIPAGIERLIMRAGQLLYNGLIFSISTNAYVAHSVAGSIEYYSYIPAFGFSAAASTLVGISLGQKEVDKAKEITWKTWFLANIIMIPIGFIFFIASPALVDQFTATKEVQTQVIQVLRLIAFFQPVIAFSNIFAGSLQGAGDTKFPMYTTFFGTWIVHIGLGYLLGIVLKLGLLGIWIAYALNNTVRSILLFYRFHSDIWTKIKMIVLGKTFAFTTLASTFLYPASLELCEHLFGSLILTNDILLCTIFSGLGIGGSLGIVIRSGASTGGMDIPPLVLQKLLRIPVSVSMYLFDFSILLLQVMIRPVENVLYGILLVLIYTLVLDKMLLLGSSKTELKIVSSRSREISDAILSQVDRGVTLLNGEGGYLHSKTQVIFSVISNRELLKVEKLAHEIDPECFMTVSRVSEVKGRGFSLNKRYK